MSAEAAEAAARVRAFLDTRATMGGLDPDQIHAANHDALTVADLNLLLEERERDAATIRRRVWLIYSSGLTTGAGTAAIQYGRHQTEAQRLGHAIAQLLAEDPLIREPLTDELVELLETGKGSSEWRPVTAYRLQHPTD